MLLETELRRVAVRTGVGQEAVTGILDRINLVEPDRTFFREAGILPGRNLRSLDALHVVTALRLGTERFLSYDASQVEAAVAAGLRVESPR